MSFAYDLPQYLLDRANIEDVLNKVYIYYDTRNEDGLARQVFAARIRVDYTKLMGGEPREYSGTEYAASVVRYIANFTSTQHYTGGMVMDLPQPGQNSTRPTTVSATVEGGAVMTRNGVQFQDGGIVTAKLTRDDVLEEKGENPWRIVEYEFAPAWKSGDPSVMEGLELW